MCGITFVREESCPETFVSSIQHRGPDHHQQLRVPGVGLFAFDRLAINDLTPEGNQPFEDEHGVLICNGEIYNHTVLRRTVSGLRSTSDCEVLLKMLNAQGPSAFRNLDAEFACVYYDKRSGELYAARDPLGVRPLFVAYDANDRVVGFSSEAKGLAMLSDAVRFKRFPPGTYWNKGTCTPFYEWPVPRQTDDDFCKHVYAIQTLLMEAVDKRVRNTERPVAYFLSGGLDSSIIAAIGASMSKEPVTTYSVGIRGSESPDLIHARLMAKHIGSDHHEISFSPEEAVSYLNRVICKLESYDCTTIRASVPMFLLANYISHNSEHRVILSGEGADELFGGYLYFHHAPNPESFQAETVRLLKNIHQFDGLRADRCTAAHGLELRVPFLDLALVDYVVAHVPPNHKCPEENHGVEKRLLREAFAHMLPKAIVDRQKNGMSDAVGYSWVDHLRAVAAPRCPDTVYAINPPLTDEERWYREIYHELYQDSDCAHETIWRPLWVTETDPSARKLKVFTK